MTYQNPNDYTPDDEIDPAKQHTTDVPQEPKVTVTISPNFYQDNLINRLDQLIQGMNRLGEIFGGIQTTLNNINQKLDQGKM